MNIPVHTGLALISLEVIKYMALLPVAVGLGLRYWINCRQYNRSGDDLRSPYLRSKLTVWAENVGKFVGALIIVAGLLLFVFFWLGQPKKKRAAAGQVPTGSIRPQKKI